MMSQNSLTEVIQEQTKRALWEVENVISCIPENLWEKDYCGMPLWKHVYHTLHSLDLWFINPRDPQYKEPDIHEDDLNNLNVISKKVLTRAEIDSYCSMTAVKIKEYVSSLNDNDLLKKPSNCEYSAFTLILAQYRHLHTHMGMIMGFIVADTGLWPRVLGLEGEFPQGDYDKYDR